MRIRRSLRGVIERFFRHDGGVGPNIDRVAIADFELLAQTVEKRTGKRGSCGRSGTRKHGRTNDGRNDLAATILDIRSETSRRVPA